MPTSRSILAPGLIAAMAIPLLAQSPAASPASAVQQQSAVAAMQQSIDKQRAAAQKQSGRSAAESFFVLPPPASLGATTPLPAAFPAEEDCPAMDESVVSPLIKDAAKREELSEDLLRSMIKQESGFHPCAVSPKGAQGLMQIMPATGAELGLKDPFDAAQNIEAGARFFKQLLTRYNGDLAKALAAYNAGPAKVDAAGGIPPIPETQNYVKQILPAVTGKQ
jgi:soluble lytic murein transglycosylase-like protein